MSQQLSESQVLLIYAIFIASPVFWLIHVIYCIVQGMWGFLIAGAICFPVGIVHGVMIWFRGLVQLLQLLF